MSRSMMQFCLRAVVAVAAMLGASSAMGQFVNVQVAVGDDAPTPNTSPGFSVHKEQRPVWDAFEDFERYRDKKAWEKAFGALAKIDEGKPGHLVPDKDGFLVPTELKVRAELLSLPPDGREAYRLFNDAKAAQMLKAVNASTPGEISALNKLVNRYFITSVGDQAADQLGDALFEAGDFSNAQRCWQLIIDSFPDSSISVPLLQTKRAMAMARYGQWEQFEEVRAILHDRYAGQKVHIGGQDVVATDFVDKLKSPHEPERVPGNAPGDPAISGFATRLPSASGLLFPSTDQPVWQIPLMDPQASNQLVAQLGQSGWANMAGTFTQAVPATAVDEKRIYVNWLGICFAADMKTGKLLWRTDTFGDMTQKMAQSMMQGTVIDPAIYTTTPFTDRVLFTRRSTENQNYNELPMTRLHCLNAENGKAVWKSDNGALSSWGFLGQPVIAGEVFYMLAHASGNQEISLLCIGLNKGDIRWKSGLGTPAPSTNYRGTPSIPCPCILVRSGKIMVLTNNGALLQVDAGTHEVEWALSYPAFIEQQMYYGYAAPASVIAPGELISFGPMLYLKEYNTNQMLAVDPAGPSVKWKRRIDPDVGITCFDGKNMLLVGSEIECLDCDSRVLNWDIKTNVHTGSVRPVIQGDWMYLFGSHGIDSIRLSTGEPGPRFKGYDLQSDGGVIWKTSSRLVTVSSRAITAYAIGQQGGTAPTTAPAK
jgi:outer membrane protein assembly factor BamB